MRPDMSKKHPRYIRIREYQAAVGKSDADISDALGITVRTYRDKINGSSDFHVGELRVLCAILGHTAPEILETAPTARHR